MGKGCVVSYESGFRDMVRLELKRFRNNGHDDAFDCLLKGTCLVNIFEWSGIATSSALNATSTNTGSSVTVVTSPTSTTSNANDLIIATEEGTVASALSAGPTEIILCALDGQLFKWQCRLYDCDHHCCYLHLMDICYFDKFLIPLSRHSKQPQARSLRRPMPISRLDDLGGSNANYEQLGDSDRDARFYALRRDPHRYDVGEFMEDKRKNT